MAVLFPVLKCPKCGGTDRFYTYAEVPVALDADERPVEFNLMDADVVRNELRCASCGYADAYYKFEVYEKEEQNG